MKTLSQVEPRTPISSAPFTITQPGSYYLTANVSGAVATNGITVSADNVTLDLAGFTLTGVAGSLNGIQVAAARINVSVLNGAIRGWGASGADLGNASNGRANGLVCVGNGGDGLVLGSNFYVSECSLNGNAGHGLHVIGNMGRVERCQAISNSLSGFRVEGTGNLVVQNSAANNPGGDYSVLAGNSYGQVVTSPGPGFASGTPWANFGGCPAGLANCNGVCTDLSTSTNNCGACGNVCAAGSACVAGACVSNPSCTDGIKNGNETGVDCGGGICPPCASGQPCVVGTDCASRVCSGGVCAVAACNDAVKNGTETDVDCGGGTCSACGAGKHCAVGNDCTSKVCTAGVCAAATCTDLVKNGAETDVDCGGGTCGKCSTGKQCVGGTDCVSGICTGNVCN